MKKTTSPEKTNFLHVPLGDTHNGGLSFRSLHIDIPQAARVPFDYRN